MGYARPRPERLPERDRRLLGGAYRRRPILDACGEKRAVIGCLSLGGYMSLAFHARHAERTRALMLFDTGPGFKMTLARPGTRAPACAPTISMPAASSPSASATRCARAGIVTRPA